MVATSKNKSKNKIVKSRYATEGSISTGMQGAKIIVAIGAYQKQLYSCNILLLAP